MSVDGAGFGPRGSTRGEMNGNSSGEKVLKPQEGSRGGEVLNYFNSAWRVLRILKFLEIFIPSLNAEKVPWSSRWGGSFYCNGVLPYLDFLRKDLPGQCNCLKSRTCSHVQVQVPTTPPQKSGDACNSQGLPTTQDGKLHTGRLKNYPCGKLERPKKLHGLLGESREKKTLRRGIQSSKNCQSGGEKKQQ